MEQAQQKLILENRQKLSITGVEEVLSFDETAVSLHTAMGMLIIQGQGLHLKALSPEGGKIEVDGTVSALSYEEPRQPGAFLSRLFK